MSLNEQIVNSKNNIPRLLHKWELKASIFSFLCIFTYAPTTLEGTFFDACI